VHVLAALQWDPQIRGGLILLTAILILCGSVYLLLATNLGARLGFLMAVAGLTGWMTLLGLLWSATPSTTGPKGRDPRWKVDAVVSGVVDRTAKPPLGQFPKGFRRLDEADPQRAEVVTAAEEFFTKEEAGKPFGIKTSADYLAGDVYDIGGEHHYLFGINIAGKGLTYKHEPHFAVVTIRRTVKQEVKPGEKPPAPQIDTTKPPLNVLVVRDLGTRRLPVFLFALGSGLVFGVTIYALHRRDTIAMRARGVLPAPAKG
jgi:hypothetical protein